TNSSIKYGHNPGAGEVVLDKNTVAKKLQKGSGKSLIGKKVTLSYSAQNSQGQPVTVKFTVKVAGISSSSVGATYVNTKTLTKAMEDKSVKPNASSLAVTANTMENSKSVAKQINKIKTNHKRVFTANAVSSMISRIETYISLITNILAGVAGISLLVSALMIIVTMYMSVADRTKEIGILRALGESKKDIRRMFIAESLIIGIFSAIVATVIAFVAQAGFNAALSKIATYAFIKITFGNVVTVFAIALIISLLAAWLPARHAAALNPIDALAVD
ncbi:MAG: ABC transporter permease, partial [Limosilactobacillus fermentum]